MTSQILVELHCAEQRSPTTDCWRIHTQTRAQTGTHTYTRALTHTHARTHARTYTHTRTHTHTHTHARTRAHIHTHTHAHTQTRAHTHTHAHTQAHARTRGAPARARGAPAHQTTCRRTTVSMRAKDSENWRDIVRVLCATPGNDEDKRVKVTRRPHPASVR